MMLVSCIKLKNGQSCCRRNGELPNEEHWPGCLLGTWQENHTVPKSSLCCIEEAKPVSQGVISFHIEFSRHHLICVGEGEVSISL